MSQLVTIQNISRFASGRPLFNGLSMTIFENERLAIVGSNGAGKSTLLKILAGADAPHEGALSVKRGLSVAYVEQQERFRDGATVYSALAEVLGAEDPDIEGKIAVTMGKTGFDDKERKVSELSGGWRKRLAIARGLVTEPELLLLDEPTNHLDIESIEWLEELTRSLSCSVVFVSHDRYFIEALASRVAELDRRYPDGVLTHEGNYSAFIGYRAEYLAQLQQQRDVLANRVRREVEWLRQGAKARTTKSRHRTAEAERMIAELKSMELNERRAKLDFAAGGKRSKELLKAEHVAKSLGGRRLFSDVTLTLSPGSRLGIVGANGSGKSTLLKVLIGQLTPDAGKLSAHHSTRISFFDQARQQLDQSLTLENALMGDAKSIVFGGVEYVAAAWAKRFLFAPEQLRLPLSRLSGGEQARVLIARLMREPSDILVLDEPTNDLDIPTLEVLEESLEEFPGAIILVTHDRYLLDRVSNEILGLFGDGRAQVFASYLQWEMAKEAHAQTKRATPVESKAPSSNDAPQTAGVRLTYGERLELGKIEDKLAKAEATVTRIEQSLADPSLASDPKRMTEECKRLADAQKEVETLYARWEELDKKDTAYKASR